MSNYDFRAANDDVLRKLFEAVNDDENMKLDERKVNTKQFKDLGDAVQFNNPVGDPKSITIDKSLLETPEDFDQSVQDIVKNVLGFPKKSKLSSGMGPTVYMGPTDYDHSGESGVMDVDPRVTIEEHHGVEPVSYMAYSNVVSMMHDVMEIMQMMNNCDDLPQWVDQSLSEAADRVAKAKRYIMSEKSKGGSARGEPIVFPSYVPSGVDHAEHAAPTMASCSCGCDACGAGTCHCPADCACGCRAGEVEQVIPYNYAF